MIKKKELIISIILISLAYYLTISSALPIKLPVELPPQANNNSINLSEIKEMIADSRLKSISISQKFNGIVFEVNHSDTPVNFTLNNSRVKADKIIEFFDQNTVKKFKKINNTHWKGEAVYYDPLKIEELWVYIQGNDLIFSFPHASSPCVNCATGTTTKTVTGLSNGSWINLTNPIQNVTTANVTFTGLTGTGNTTYGRYRYDSYISNGTGVFSVNISNLIGTSNRTHWFLNGRLNGNFTNINFSRNNGSLLQHWNQTINGSINIKNGWAQFWVKIPDGNLNGTPINVWVTSSTSDTFSNNRSDGTKVFNSFWDFTTNSLPTGWTAQAGDGITFDNGIMDVWNSPGWEWVNTGADYSAGIFLLTQEKRIDAGVGAHLSGFGDGGLANLHDDTNSVVSASVGNCPTGGNKFCQDVRTWNSASGTIAGDGINWDLINNRWQSSSTGLFVNSTNISYYNEGLIPNVALRVEFSTYQHHLYVDFAAVGNPTDIVLEPIGAENDVGPVNISVYVIPQNHPISENKTLSQTAININLTLTSGVSLQNVQLFSNSSSSYSATLTVNYTNNTEITNESFFNGFWIMNATFKLPVDSTNVSFNYTATYPSYDTIGAINVTSTQESNRTSTTTTGSYINTTFYQLPSGIDVLINYSRAYDVLAILSQPANQSTVVGSTLTHSIAVTDTTKLSQNISWDYEGDGTIDAYGTSNQKTYNSIGTRNGRVYVNTSTTLGTWDNQTKFITTVVNQSVTISNITNITQAENSTVYVDIDAIGINGTASFSTNRSDLFTNFNSATGIGTWRPNYTSNGTYYIDFGVNDTANYRNSNQTMIINITNTLLPVSTSQVNPTSVTNGNTVNISLTINGSGINVTSAKVRVENPNSVVQNFTMSCSGTTDTLCFKVYTTAVRGEHLIRFFYLKDETLTENQVESLLTFTATAAPSGGGGGGGGGGTSVTNIIVQPTPTPTPVEPSLNLSLIEITEGTRPVSDIDAINKCLTTEFLISPRCKSATTIALANQKNWFALSGAFIGAIVSTWGLNLSNAIYLKKRKRSYFDALIYAVTAIIVTLGLNWVGFNFMFLFNYLYSNSLSAYTFATFVLWGFLTNTTMQELIFPKKTFYNVRKINL